jgi:threonylcarbamoyladenosine tRNA methylthiotransferase MtaB
MNRPYTPQEYELLVKKILTTNPDIAIGTDIMVGFPSETTDDFQLTESFVDSLPLAYLHVFVYSPRPHTPAATFKGHLKSLIKKERGKIIREISRRKRQEFIKNNLNSVRPTVVLSKPASDGVSHTGLTDNYIQVVFQSKENLAELSGEILPTRLTQLHHDPASALGSILW